MKVMVTTSAGTGYMRLLESLGTQVLLTGETEPLIAQKILAGEALADTRFDVTTTLCKLRDVFSRH